MRKGRSKSFTLIELLIVIGIIAILAGTVIIAINPARQFAQTRNARRWSDVNAILNALHQYTIDHGGNLPPSLAATAPGTFTDVGTCCLNLADPALNIVPRYLAAIPVDPRWGNASTTHYLVAHGGPAGAYRLTVRAERAELGETISVTR